MEAPPNTPNTPSTGPTSSRQGSGPYVIPPLRGQLGSPLGGHMDKAMSATKGIHSQPRPVAMVHGWVSLTMNQKLASQTELTNATERKQTF